MTDSNHVTDLEDPRVRTKDALNKSLHRQLELVKERNREREKFAAAAQALNRIDDRFEYAYKNQTPEQLQKFVRQVLSDYTKQLNGE